MVRVRIGRVVVGGCSGRGGRCSEGSGEIIRKGRRPDSPVERGGGRGIDELLPSRGGGGRHGTQYDDDGSCKRLARTCLFGGVVVQEC